MRWVIYRSKKYDSRENDARSHKVHERRFLPFRVQKLWKSMTIIVKIQVFSIQAVKLFFLKENLYDVIRQGQLSSSSITCKQPKVQCLPLTGYWRRPLLVNKTFGVPLKNPRRRLSSGAVESAKSAGLSSQLYELTCSIALSKIIVNTYSTSPSWHRFRCQ